MNFTIRKSLLAVAVSGLLAAPLAHATNGYFMHGYSTKNKGLAGAGAAFSQDAMAAAVNPAGMAFVGKRVDLGLQIFSPSPRSYTVTGNPIPAGTPLNFLCQGEIILSIPNVIDPNGVKNFVTQVKKSMNKKLEDLDLTEKTTSIPKRKGNCQNCGHENIPETTLCKKCGRVL